MISIGKLTSAEAAVNYLQHAVADNAVDYYNLRGEAPGRWDGRGAERLELQGEIAAEQLRAILNGWSPKTGQQLGRRWASQKIVAFDVTFSAPKSVSLMYALGDDETRRSVLDAHEAGVDAAISYLQTHAGWTRQFIPETGLVEPVSGEMIMPRFRHRTSRPVTDPTTGKTTIDPQLHTHIPIPTWVCRTSGKWSALLSQPLYMHAAAAGTVGQAAMRKVLVDRLGVQVEVGPNGTFEIAGIGEAQRREFSRRRQQIAVAEQVFGITSIQGRETANLATREGKAEPGVGPGLFDEWKARAQSVGLDASGIQALLYNRGPAEPLQLSGDVVRDLVGEAGLTAEAATFGRRDLVRCIAALATDGLAHIEIEQLADAVLRDRANIVTLGKRDLAAVVTLDVHADESARVPFQEERFSTPEMVWLERRMLDIARGRQRQQVALVSDKAVAVAIAKRPALSDEQRSLVNAVCKGGDGVVVVEGVAGAGKTFALDACREAFEAGGHKVIGYALAGRAAQTLEEEAAIPSHTIARAIPSLIEERLAPRTVIVVDEAGMVGSRQLAQLVELTARDGAKLVLCGDPRQLQPIDGGAGFRALSDHLGKVRLMESRRQKEVWEREALMMIRDGAVSSAVESYQRHQRVAVSETAMARRHDVVAASLESKAGGLDTVVLTRTRDEASALNELSRAVRKSCGELQGESVSIGGREFLVGDQALCVRNRQRLGITNGLRGEVVAVDPRRERLTIRTKAGDVLIDGRRYSHLEYGYALTAHKAQGITVDVALVVGSEATSREWVYSVLSRARLETRYFAVKAPPTRDVDGVRHGQEGELTLAQRLVQAWSPSEAKDSTLDYMPPVRQLTESEGQLAELHPDQRMRR